MNITIPVIVTVPVRDDDPDNIADAIADAQHFLRGVLKHAALGFDGYSVFLDSTETPKVDVE